jgi:tetraacyldisaccharide 4'-kinase
MNQSWITSILLSPFALLYGAIVSIRAFLYRTRLLRSSRFDVPVISVGNLSTGGTGKTPHIEYLVRLLQPYINVSVLSRGYKRKSEGFRMVHPQDNVLDVGDEPLLFKLKYPSVPVAVSERRAYAIPQMLYRQPEIQTILLDDAFQHLAVTPYLNILLTEYRHPFTKDFLLPSGNLRDWRSTYKRSNIIVVTKCPFDMQLLDKQRFINEIKPLSHQKIFFSSYIYSKPYRLFDPSVFYSLDAETEVLLVCGIARTEYLLSYLASVVKSVTTLEFEDHRLFSNYDVAQFKRLYEGLSSRKKIIITTEKDATRLDLHRAFILENQLYIYVLPIEVDFLFDEKENFNFAITQALLDFKI